MKKVMIFLVMLMILPGIGAQIDGRTDTAFASSPTVFEENFSSYSEGSFGGRVDANIIKQGDNQYLNIQATALGATMLEKNFSKTYTDFLSLSFDYMPSNTTAESITITFRGSDTDDGSNVYNYISSLIGSGGVVNMVGGNTGTYTFPKNVFTKVTYLIDLVNHKYDVYFGEEKRVSGLLFREYDLLKSTVSPPSPIQGKVGFTSFLISTPSTAGANPFVGNFGNITLTEGTNLPTPSPLALASPTSMSYPSPMPLATDAPSGFYVSALLSDIATKSSSVEVSTTVFNSTAATKKGFVIGAVKNGKKLVASAVTPSVDFVRGATATAAIWLNIPPAKGDYSIELYVFEDANRIMPIAKKKIILNSYSNIFFSSRFQRSVGDSGANMTSFDAAKRFMVSAAKWSYETRAPIIGGYKDLGISFQGAIGTTTPTSGNIGAGKNLEGTNAVAPWMTWGAVWGCINNPDNLVAVHNSAKGFISGGASSIHHDDALTNTAMVIWGGGCFCDYCMTGFKSYLKTNFSAQTLNADYGITDIDTFNYKSYLSAKGITTQAVYFTTSSSSLPIKVLFNSFQSQSSVKYLDDLRSDLNAFAGRNIALSANLYGAYDINRNNNGGINRFDYFISEHTEATSTVATSSRGGLFKKDAGIGVIISPYPTQNDNSKIKADAAAAYAFGQYYLVPWDIYTGGSSRYFGDNRQIGDVFEFIAENNFLFDNMENRANTAVLVNADELDNDTKINSYYSLIDSLRNAGVIYKNIVVGYNTNAMSKGVTTKDLEGIEKIILFSYASLNTADKALINGATCEKVDVANVASLVNAQAQRVVPSDAAIYVTARGDGSATSVHLLNNDRPQVKTNVSITVGNSFIPQNTKAYLYAPGKSPLPLSISSQSATDQTYIIPTLNEWAVIYFAPCTITGGYNLPLELTKYNVGNPSAFGSGYVEGGKLTIQSGGKGFGQIIAGVDGTADSVSFVYKRTQADFDMGTSITQDIAASGGLMVREGPYSNSRMIAIEKTGDGKLNFIKRETANDKTTSQTISFAQGANYLRMVKAQGKLSVYVSSDKVNFYRCFEATMDYSNYCIGAFAYSQSASIAKSAFGDFYIQ